MNILYVLNSGSPGGMEKHVLDLTLGMINYGHKVFIWCNEGDLVPLYKKTGAEVCVCPIKFDIDLIYIIKLRKFLRANKIQVIHTQELKAGVNGIIASVLAGVPVKITHIHTPISEWRVFGWVKIILTKISSFLYSLMVNSFGTVEIALTESRKQKKLTEGIIENKIIVIPNGIDIDGFAVSPKTRIDYRNEILSTYKIPEDSIIIGNLSRTTEEKGHDLLIKTFAAILGSSLDVKGKLYLLIAGGGKLENQLRQLIKSLNIGSRAVITGIFEPSMQVKFYSSFDIFVFPSLAEGFGYVLVEAMASKLPVLSSDIDVLKEIGGDTIKYFKTNDISDLQSKLSSLINDYKSDKYNLCESAYENIKQYSLESFHSSYLKLYEKYLK